MQKRNVTVLYVDDEEFNLFLFKITFEKKYAVYTASSGFDGLKILDEHHTDIIVVISDMKMPNMNGVEFIKKAREKYDHIFYFILSGFDSNPEIENAIEEKIIHQFFSKPFEINEIEKAINTAAANSE